MDTPLAPEPSPRRFVITNRVLMLCVAATFLSPSLLIAASFRAPAAVAIWAGGALGLYVLSSTTRRSAFLTERLQSSFFLSCLGLAAALLTLGGETHVFFPTGDWLIRDAALGDLSRAPYPPLYEFMGDVYFLRAPLGMYMTPAAVGRLLGVAAAHGAMLAQNALLIGACFYLFGRLGRGWLTVALFAAFAPLAIPGILAGMAAIGHPSLETLRALPLYSLTLDAWNPYFLYPGAVAQMFWAPNHSAPAWVLAILMILHARGQIGLAAVGIMIALTAFWSPLAILPAVAWLAFSILRDPGHELRDRALWLGGFACLGFLPLGILLSVDAGAIQAIAAKERPGLLLLYALWTPFALWSLIYLVWRRDSVELRLKPLLWMCGAFALVLPFLQFGPYNDLVRRGALSCLAIFAFLFAETLADAWRRKDAAFAVGVALAVLMTASPAFEIARALILPTFPISDCHLGEASAAIGTQDPPPNYVAPLASRPDWLLPPFEGAPLRIAPKRCRPDYGPTG